MIWTKQDIRIERIFPDDTFWSEHNQKLSHFFKVEILPELLGKFFSRPQTTQNPSEVSLSHCDTTVDETDSTRVKYCYCQEEKEGEMIGCDNPLCQYEWFHFECLRLTSKPKSKLWYCPDCRKLPEF